MAAAVGSKKCDVAPAEREVVVQAVEAAMSRRAVAGFHDLGRPRDAHGSGVDAVAAGVVAKKRDVVPADGGKVAKEGEVAVSRRGVAVIHDLGRAGCADASG